ncbi:MAG: recombination protein RecR [Alphaproteobacteria bacterium]|nr:recombination protein RecR [Alphaproteobacteria bacterium]
MAEGPALEELIRLLARLPGLGPRSARRAVLQLMKRRDHLLEPLIARLREVADTVKSCATCGNFDTADPCAVCADPRRDPGLVCVVEDVADLWAMERAQVFRGRYHVLGGALSALDGIGPDDLAIPGLVARIASGGVAEVILATNATVDGQTTAHYISERLRPYRVAVTRLARGVPVGGELDYMDDGTIATALRARKPVEA